MSKIEQPKTYTGTDLDTIFFRPMFSGPGAQALGIRTMYNMPMPTTLHFWKRAGDILQSYTKAGWNGGKSADKYQKTIGMSRVKAEVSYSADEYFSLVYEKVTNRGDVNMDDLTGTELEQAETTLFKEAIAESVRTTMWLGDTSRIDAYNTFDGFLKRIFADISDGEGDISSSAVTAIADPSDAELILMTLWDDAPIILREFKQQGQLAYFVTSDIYRLYEEALDLVNLDSAYQARQHGRERLAFRGIPVIDVQLSGYLPALKDMPSSFALLTDRRNLALAVNTSVDPGNEIKMWYNPDLMENRQRAIFMAGCDYLMPELISIAYKQ